MESRSKRTKANLGNKKFLIIVAILSTILICSIAGLIISMNNLVGKWDNKIYSGVDIENIDVSGLTVDEAVEKLTDEFQTKILDKKLSVVIDGTENIISYSEIDPSYNISEIVTEAYNYGKEFGVFGKYKAIKGRTEKSFDLSFSFDEEKLSDIENKLASEVNKSATDAKIVILNGNTSITPEKQGQELNLENLDATLKETISGDLKGNEKIDVSTEKVDAKVKSSDLGKIDGIIGTYTSNYSTSAAGRAENIEIATRKINGTLLMPGDTFSFNEVVGPRTVEAGFKEAGTYVGNKVEPGIGGGICQVSTALYRAVMHANIRSVERTNHSMTVGYAAPGLDATVAYGYIDYKFKNTYDFPIYIEGIISGRNVTYNVYGNVAGLGGKTYDMTSEIVQTMYPEEKYVNDSTLDVGTQVVDTAGTVGYKTISYQITYENGVEVNREVISNDTYIKVDKIIKVGTKARAATPNVVSPPATVEQTSVANGESNTQAPTTETTEVPVG